MKSHPFRMLVKIPLDIVEGGIHTDVGGDRFIITKIKSVKFIDMRTMEVVGLCKSV